MKIFKIILVLGLVFILLFSASKVYNSFTEKTGDKTDIQTPTEKVEKTWETDVALETICNANEITCESQGIMKKITYDCDGIEQTVFTSLTDLSEIENEINLLKTSCEKIEEDIASPSEGESVQSTPVNEYSSTIGGSA